MADHVFKFQSNRVNLVSSRRFLITDYVLYLRCFFLCHVMLLSHCLELRLIHIQYTARRPDFQAFRESSREGERENSKCIQAEEKSVLSYGDLL